MRIPLIYIAGPFTARTSWEVELNVRRAESAALAVAKLGALPICPHTNTRFFHDLLEPSFWLRGYREVLRRCDAMYLVGPYWLSEGTKDEIECAMQHPPIPRFDQIEALSVWLKHRAQNPEN